MVLLIKDIKQEKRKQFKEYLASKSDDFYLKAILEIEDCKRNNSNLKDCLILKEIQKKYEKIYKRKINFDNIYKEVNREWKYKREDILMKKFKELQEKAGNHDSNERGTKILK